MQTPSSSAITTSPGLTRPPAHTTGTFTGQATQALPLNAQFIARSLRVSSQGNLFLRPNLADAIVTPIPGGIEIIR